MKLSQSLLLVVCLSWIQTPARAEPLPKSIASAPCRTPPVIDGAIAEDEWRDAKVYDFDLEMASVNPPAKSNRGCQLRVMNSANALYVAFRVPDVKVNASFDPLDFDLAILGFCKGKQLADGDDRKSIGPGIYLDKHFVAPNKDADDKQSDGRGAVQHAKGVYSFEWAIPLDSGDPQDLQAKPGDSLRYNLAFFDSFKADLKDTQIGGTYGLEMDKADNWGTLVLADKVEKDNGSAFRGPPWAEAILKSDKRVTVEDSVLLPHLLQPAVKVSIAFKYRDPHGKPMVGKAAVYLPTSLREKPTLKLPLYFVAGYELDDNNAMAHVRRGFAVVSPRLLETNPLIRTQSPDIALLHIARALPFVDDAHVVIGGGSAGGYMTLMLAAETFPLAVALPDVPPVNWGYNAAYFFKQAERLAPAKGETVSKVPVLHAVGSMLSTATKVFGDDFGDATWYAHSPVAHVATITCPVSVWWTTADMLVPMDQVGKKWVKEFDAKQFPAGFTMDPEKLLTSKEGRTRLMDVLDEKDFEIFEIKVPKETLKAGDPPNSGKPYEAKMPVSPSKQWSIVILDEGPPEPRVGHAKYLVGLNRDEILKNAKVAKTAANQLTEAKLARLMDRYAGKEWLPNPLRHLDEPANEKADVLRGLRTYAKGGAENAKTFAGLYARLPKAKQVLAEDLVKELSGK